MLRRLVPALPVPLLLASLSLIACQDGVPFREDSPSVVEIPSVGAIHNEFLDLLYAKLDDPRRVADGSRPWAAIVEAADAIADKYGAPRLGEQQILEAVELGERLAGQDPRITVASLLAGEELEWWERYASEAGPADARAVFESHVARFGAPLPGGDLALFVDVAVHSSEFWTARHGVDGLYFYGADVDGLRKLGWRKVLRFFTAVAVDGLSGSAATAGAGPVAGAIVGGLSSLGADCLLYGCD